MSNQDPTPLRMVRVMTKTSLGTGATLYSESADERAEAVAKSLADDTNQPRVSASQRRRLREAVGGGALRSPDPTRIDLQSQGDSDPLVARLRGVAVHGNTPSTVEAGWLDDDGAATDPDVLQRTAELLDAIVLQGIPTPRVFPVPDGGMQAEWTLGDREVSVTVEPGGTLYVISVNVVSGDAEDATVANDDVAEVLRLVVR